ncbi:titin homolog isoform X8 [Bactrocera dorsalis]|uniref:Titin homolog isoform X8 n=1 Tax=Bactrocera dorsalis TaxID=27457 RepID=A0ABM3K0E8_BACDO|nr:titin homolog isoform X8 [Bactrocera dorsalis]
MEEDVLNALQTRTAYLAGGYDRAGKIIVVVNIINDLQLWNRRCLELSIAYLKSALSAATLQRGVTVIVDAQKSTTRITRTHARIIYALFDEITVNLFLVRAEGFWEKHVDTCTSKSQAKGEPIVLSKARLIKYFDLSQLPEELGGTLSFNYDLWLQQRKAIDEFQKTFDSTLSSMENLHVVLLNNKSLRPTEADVELKKCAQLHTSVQQQIEVVIELGNRVLNRLSEAYAPPIAAPTPQISATTNVLTPAINNTATIPCHESHNNNNSVQTQTNFNCTTANTPATRLPLPPDLQYARARIELLLNQIERKQTEIRTAWLELLQSIREARELTHLEEGVAFVTNWILQTAEQMLSRQYSIGGDVHSCETLRAAHDVLELECRETYGFYAELLYKIDAFAGVKDSHAYKDLMSQCDFMQFVCRSFATRLERRRNVLITSLRFFRLVSEYFDRTTAVFETLVMGNKIAEENFVTAAETLQQLKESQLSLGNLERELVKEGEKLSDMLAMPVKDALGRDLHIDYSEDIGNVRDILDTTLARRNIFGDSVELQKLTLEQVTHIYTYEADGRMAIKWMEDLYNVMIKCHSHVGCNIHEIQVQKDELQTFQETGKSIYNYGCQLLEASQALRISCRLDAEAIPQRMSQQLQHTWHRLQAISQEHMTRLRVSAVFHRSVEEYCQQLQELRLSVRNLKQTPNSSSGISSESDTRASPPIIIGGRETVDEAVERSSRDGAEEEGTTHSIGGYADKSTTTSVTTTTKGGASGAAALLRDQLRKHLVVREQLLLEVGRMVRLGRLLKTRLKEPFVLDAVTGMSITVDELATDASSSAGDTQTQSSSSPVGTVDSASTVDSNTIVIKPTGNNDIACAAISHKLQEIAEVAESLDAAIRDVQQDAEALEVNATSSAEKKREAMRSYSSEDWHSRSTEDDSFVTASEGNFTPHSHSSSYQTASGRTSSFISCDKSSFDVSEADDSTFASTFEIPADINMSYDGTEHSFVSAQQQDSTPSPQQQELHQQQNTNDSPSDGGDDGDGSSIADIEELHSQSVTPTPGDGDVEHYNYQSIPIESESDLESSCIADSPSLQVLTEEVPVTSVTPESPDKLYIKVVELEPKITTLGTNLDESIRLQRDHDETLRNIQNLPGPMDEFVQKADKLLASKRISSELVNAMADTLNIIWQDILHLLQDRQHILHLATQLQEKMAQCQRRMDQLEVACIDTMLPIEVAAVQEFLNKFKQLRIDMLTAVMAALKDGNELLAQLKELVNLETLDTRPEHIKRDAARAVHQVQLWLEAPHDRRNALETAWQTRKVQLEHCLTLALLGRELDEVEAALRQQRSEVDSLFSLGECEHTANNALHNYREWKQQALLLRDRALKITRAKEKLQASGTFTGDEACARAYNVLSACTEHLDLVDQREHWLQQSRDFFAKAENTLSVLEKLEVELANVRLPPNTPESFTMYAKVTRDVRSFTEEPLRLGYSILDEVGRTQPETQGVKRVLDEIENRKTYIESICSTSNEDHQRVQKALSDFLAQYNDLLNWLMSSGQLYLQQHVDMGSTLEQSKQFLLQHHELMQDLEIKGELINLLLESIKAHLESLSPQQRYDVDSKAEALHKHWIELKDLVLKRVDCVSLLIEFFEKANELASQLDNLDKQLKQTADEQKLQFLQENWKHIRADYADLKSLGTRFINLKIVDPYLETKSSVTAVEDILNGFSKRQVDVTTSLDNWTTQIAEKREVEIILEKIMSDNEETATKTTQVDTQLYPVFTSSSLDARQLHTITSDKLTHVLQDIDKAQDELQHRIHTTLGIQTKNPESLQKIEQVISNLRALKSKLEGIRYDYKTLLENILKFLAEITELQRNIDDFFAKQQQQQSQLGGSGGDVADIERTITEHEKFRDTCMDKFRSLITQSELLIDRVRALEPPGAREIDTDRILKLLENLRLHFEAGNSERMSRLERLGKLEQFKTDLCDINRSLDSVSKQLHEINEQSVDSLAAAKTTSLAFEYFERTIENSMPTFLVPVKHQLRWGHNSKPLKLLEKRIDKFTETTSEQLLITNPESQTYVREELQKLNEKWRHFKDQVKNKRKSLDQATEFFEKVEKIDAEYREISYFYNSVSNKITYLRDPVEASNLVNDIEKYVVTREGPLLDKLEQAAQCAHDLNKVSTLYNDVRGIFQAFMKLRSDISVVQERLKNEERLREQREKEAREQEERERAAREAEAKERAARESAERERVARELAAREQALRDEEARLLVIREQAAREQAAREQAAREEEARLQALREQAQRDEEARLQALREQARREEETRLEALRQEEARLQVLREQTKREEEARLQALREQAAREEEARLQALREQARREEEARLETLRKEEARLQALREQTKREEEARLQALREQTVREEEARLQALREQARREEENRLLALREQATREEEARLQALREQTKRDEFARLQSVRDQIDHQRIVTENIRKDIQVNEIFTEIKYASPRFNRQLKDAITREGDKFTFECEVVGNPEPAVEWFKDGISIQNNPDYKTTYERGICRLVIEETFTADSARFSCRASNLVGSNETSANLSVRENAIEMQMVPPRIVRFLESGKATEGSTFEFLCVVSGNPLPTVQWYKNDKCIDDSPDYVINYNNGEATLRFEEVFLEDDAVYTCSASNPAGIEHCSASLIVEPLEPTEVPHFKIPLSNAMARVGQKIKLEALIGGIPRPDIFWMHNGKPYVPRDSKYEYGRATLIIPQAYPNDAGVYVLTAKNLAGEAYSSCNVVVKGRLPNETSDSELASDMEPIKPSVQLPLKDVSIFEGKPVRLDCVIVGQPEPEVIWYHNERPVKESADVQLLFQGDRCSLIIQEVYQEDAGNYKVVAINSAGEASSSCELKVTPLNIAEPATRAQTERQSVPKETLPKFDKFLTDVLADEGETVEMEVSVSGDQPLTAKWYLANKELSESERLSMSANPAVGGFKLILKNVVSDDRGVYTVKVSNNAGDAKCFSQLNVKSVNAPENQRSQQVEPVEKLTCPEFKELFSDKQAYADDMVKFECIVKGKPTPKVHWCFNEQPVHGHNFLVSTSGDRQVLTIQKASIDTVGKISCIAENEIGKATCAAYLNLLGPGMQLLPATSDLQTSTQEHNTESSRVTIKKQTFTTTSTSQISSFEGNMPQTEIHHSSAHIDQSLKQLGAQQPEVIETHHYQELHKSKDMSTPNVQQKLFTLVQSAGNGPSQQPAITGTAGVAVPESPTRLRKQIAPRFTTPLTGKIVDQGTDVAMEAIYDGFPSPEIKVEKNGEQLFENQRLKIENRCNRVSIELKQVGVADAGRYAVTATNTMGQSTSTADLVVKKTIFPPVFGRRLQAQVVKRGEKIIMEVEVTGLPEPTVTWMKDDKPIQEAGVSQHRLLSQGNSYKLIIEKGQSSDSGKYMVKATNAGGEAKSIADCAILEPSPERLQEVVKTIVYETPAELKTETFAKEPPSFETTQTEISNASDLHGLSESKIVTEHRCTTEATMRLEHKQAYLDLPALSERPKTPTAATNISTNTELPDWQHLKSVSTNTDSTRSKTGSTQTPPQVPPKPYTTANNIAPTPTIQQSQFQSTLSTELDGGYKGVGETPLLTSATTTTSTSKYESTTSEKKSSSFDFFKKIESQGGTQPAPPGERYQKQEVNVINKRTTPLTISRPSGATAQSATLEDDLKNLNLIPGSPPEICFIPKLDTASAKPQMINDRIKILEASQQSPKEPPTGGIRTLPLLPVSQTFKHESTMSKEVKVEYGQPIIRPAATLPAPQQFTRSPSPKPSAEGVAMSKLWTPSNLSGYESATSELEQRYKAEAESDTKVEHREIRVQKVPTPAPDLSAPYLVKEISKAIHIPTTPQREKTPLDDIHLVPGSPPEICFAPKPEVRRQSLVETMEKTLEKNLQQGPTKVLPMSVPTLTPTTAPHAPKTTSTYKPPPPVIPTKLTVGQPYESDYESDRWKYSGSESDEASFRPVGKSVPEGLVGAPSVPTTHHTFKTSGYAADTEEISSYRKMESTHQESRSFYESTSSSKSTQQLPQAPMTSVFKTPPQQQQYTPQFAPAAAPAAAQTFYQQPHLEKQPPAPIYYTSKEEGGHEKQEYSDKNEYRREEKNYKSVSSMSSSYYNASNISNISNISAPKYQSVPLKIPTPTVTPVPAQRKTPAEFSDYSSEVEERFRSVSRTQESDNEIKGYRVVFPPTPTPKSHLTNGHKSPAVVVTPSPMDFEPTPPAVSTYPRQKFEPIKKEVRHEIKTESKEQKQYFQQQKTQQQQQQVYKPKPVAAKFIAATQQQQQQQQQQPRYEPRPQPALYYNAIAGTPLHTAKMATETKNVMHMKESSETCQRVVNMQQTKRVIHFDSQKEQQERQVSTPLEPFPYSPSPSRYTPTQQTRVPPPPTPTKFVPGEFRESDYDSEIENAKIRPLWTPHGENGPLRFRHVEPPQMGRACSVPRAYERVLSPMEFDRGPEMPAKIKVDPNELRSQRGSSLSATSQRTQSLNRHSSLKSSTSSSYQQRYQTLQPDATVVEKRFPRDDMNLKVGSPPKYGYIQSQIDQQGKQMSSTFLQKSHQFISDITNDLQQKSSKTTKIYNGSAEPKVITHSFRPGFKRAPSEGDNKPQAYRDESRVSQYATELPSDVPVNAHLNRDDYPKRAPQFITPLKEYAVMLGQIARFECIVQSHPTANVTWSRNGVALQNSAKYVIEYRNGVCRLTIPQAYPDDAGVYACTATNPLGTATTSGQLLVQAKRL